MYNRGRGKNVAYPTKAFGSVTFPLSFVLNRERRTKELLERDYQKNLVKKLKNIFPGCIVLKNDAQLKQGIPDLLVLFNDKWAALEVKRSEAEYRKAITGKGRPNQDFKVNRMNDMSYAAFIYPENEEKIFSELKEVFE